MISGVFSYILIVGDRFLGDGVSCAVEWSIERKMHVCIHNFIRLLEDSRPAIIKKAFSFMFTNA